MKKIILSFLSFVFVLGVGLGLSQFGIFKEEKKVKAAEDVFIMDEGASFRSYYTTPNCGISFGATLTNTNPYVDNVKLFIAPYDFVETVLQRKIEIEDYIEAFNTNYNLTTQNQAKMPVENSYYTIVEPAIYKYSDVVSYKGGLKNIQAGNESRRFFGIYYYYDTSAEKNVYATMPNGEIGQARSIAYLASGQYNKIAQNDEVVTNDEYMTSFWMERAIKTAVSKSDDTVDTSTIKYTEGENKTTTIIGGKASGTYFDDYLTISGTRIQIGTDVINVGQRLNFAVKYNANDYVENVGTAYVNTKKVTDNDVGVSVKIGREEINAQNFSVNIAKYDLAKATLTASDTKFTGTISSENNTLVDSYKSTNVTPSSIVLNVPTGGNVLWAKTLNYNDIIAIGSLNYNSTSADARWEDNGGNGELTNANTQIKLNLTTTLSGNNFINSVSRNSTATKNSFSLTINYTYSDSYEQDGEVAATGQSNKYYYGQTYNYVETEIDGYTAYLDQNRQTKATTATIKGTVDATVYYMPNTYTLTVGYLNTGRENTTLNIKYGYPYKVNAPTINGLSPTQNSISGNMESLGYAVNFTYNSTAYSADGNVYYQGYPISTQANFAKASDSDILGGAASPITGNYAGGFVKTDPSVTKFYLYSSSINTPTNGFVVAESAAFEFDLISLGSENDTEADGKFGVIIESVENSEHRNFIYLTKGSTSLKKSISYANNTNTVTEESTLIDSVGSTSGVRVSLYKKGSSITITVGTKSTTYTDENLAGNCFIGIFGVKVTYNFANAVYRVDSAKAYFAKVTNNYHSSGTSEATATHSALSGNPFIGEYTKSEGDCDKFYLFRDYSTTTSYLRAGTLFLEFEYKLTSVVSSSKTAKFGVALENSSGKHFIYFRVANGVDKKDIYINNYYADSNGQLTDSSGNVISEDNGKVDTVYSMPDVTAQFVKFSIYKNGTEVIVRVNDIIVYQYQNSKLSGRCYYALFGTYSAYVIKNARYCFDSTKVPTLFTASLEAYHSKDVSATNFYYQTDIQVHATESDNSGKACKVGILVKLNDDNLLWFYWDLLGASEPSEKSRKVSMVYKVNGSYNWRSSKDTVVQAGKTWVGGERYVYIPNGNMGYSNTVIGGGVNTFSVLKQGSTVTFMLNGIPCLQSTHANFAGACTVGVLSQYQSYTAFNGIYITDATELDNIAIEKGIVNEGITIDGTISDAEWTAGGLNVTQETASNGEYFKTKAFLGRSFIYVIGEFATTNYRDNAIVGDGTEEDAEIINSYKTWSNTNVEIRCYHNFGDTSYYRRAYVNSILNSASVSNFSFSVTKNGSLSIVTYEIMIPYCTFGYPNSTNSTYLTLAVKPGVIGANDSTLYSNPELGAWWSDSIKHEITGCGIS